MPIFGDNKKVASLGKTLSEKLGIEIPEGSTIEEIQVLIMDHTPEVKTVTKEVVKEVPAQTNTEELVQSILTNETFGNSLAESITGAVTTAINENQVLGSLIKSHNEVVKTIQETAPKIEALTNDVQSIKTKKAEAQKGLPTALSIVDNQGAGVVSSLSQPKSADETPEKLDGSIFTNIMNGYGAQTVSKLKASQN